MRSRRRATLVAALAVLAVTAAACSDDGRTMRPPSPDQTESILVTTTSGPAVEPSVVEGSIISVPWTDGGEIPLLYTCRGDDVSPAIGWSNLPAGTVEVAITMLDLDAEDFVHWVVTGLDPAVGQVPQDGVPEDATQTLNDTGSVGYAGPCPPAGSGTHTYLVTLYPLGQPSGVIDGSDPRQAIARIEQLSLPSAAAATGTFAAA